MQPFKKIVVVGPQGQGKSTFINDFIKEFPNFKTPETTYRDVVNEQNLKLNRICDKYSQKILTDFNYNQITASYNNDMIFDRCLIDNLIYSEWSYLHGSEDIDLDFLDYTKNHIDDMLNCLNLIIFIPLADEYKIQLVDDGIRDTSIDYLIEIDRLFKHYFHNNREFSVYTFINGKTIKKQFDSKYNDSNFIIISGTRINRIEQIKNYIANNMY